MMTGICLMMHTGQLDRLCAMNDIERGGISLFS